MHAHAFCDQMEIVFCSWVRVLFLCRPEDTNSWMVQNLYTLRNLDTIKVNGPITRPIVCKCSRRLRLMLAIKELLD